MGACLGAAACGSSDDDASPQGASGQGGSGGSGGASGQGGSSGNHAGASGQPGQAGASGGAGTAGQGGAGAAGSGGQSGAGAAGQGGQGGQGGASGASGSSGASGASGSSGASGAGAGGEGGSAGQAGQGGSSGQSGQGGQGGPAPTFTQVKATVFASCGAKFGLMTCHGKDPFQGSLDLVGPDTYANLVGVPADIDPTLTRVIPGDPDASFVYRKLVNDLPGDMSLGDPMPKGEAIAWKELPQEQIDLLRAWILAGAKND